MAHLHPRASLGLQTWRSTLTAPFLRPFPLRPFALRPFSLQPLPLLRSSLRPLRHPLTPSPALRLLRPFTASARPHKKTEPPSPAESRTHKAPQQPQAQNGASQAQNEAPQAPPRPDSTARSNEPGADSTASGPGTAPRPGTAQAGPTASHEPGASPHSSRGGLLLSVLTRTEAALAAVKHILKRLQRPFNTDDYLAFFLWILVLNVLLIALATTTFVSLVIYTFNSLFAQELVAQKLGEILTKNSKLSVVFEKAIVPGWRDGKICFNGVVVSRRPRQSQRFEKAALDAAPLGLEGAPVALEVAPLGDVAPLGLAAAPLDLDAAVDDGNYTQYDLTIEEVTLTLLFSKWMNGRGFVDTLEMKGVRGVVDRTHVRWDPNDLATNYKNVYHPGDFEIDDFKVNDVSFTLLQPDGFRPFVVELYSLNCSQLRKHWLFYDLLNASNINGSYDGALFTIHRTKSSDKRVQRLRIDSLSVDHLNRGLEGPFGWISRGRVDMLGELQVPREPHWWQKISTSGTANGANSTASRANSTASGPSATAGGPNFAADDVRLDLALRLHHVRALVPFQAPELSYVNYALIAPIVGYINSHNTYIEIQNQVVKPLSDFAGSWTVYDSLLMDDISLEVYDNFAKYVADEERRGARMKRVVFWSLQALVQVVVSLMV